MVATRYAYYGTADEHTIIIDPVGTTNRIYNTTRGIGSNDRREVAAWVANMLHTKGARLRGCYILEFTSRWDRPWYVGLPVWLRGRVGGRYRTTTEAMEAYAQAREKHGRECTSWVWVRHPRFGHNR